MSHFEQMFEPDKDIIYGTGDWIHVYLYNFWFIWPYGYQTLTGINDKTGGYKFRSLNPYDARNPDNVDQVTAAAHNKYGVNVINNYNLPIKSNLYKMSATGDQVVKKKDPVIPLQKSSTERKRYEDYFRCLENSVGYGPGSLLGKTTDLESALAKYEQRDNLDLTKKRDFEKLPGIISDIAIRRSCKFGIHYFVERKSARLHYILDGMDVDAIVRKDRYTNEVTGKAKVPICTSEVRYIFRHWNRLSATNRLLFYLNFNTVEAPWSNNTFQGTWPGWADYAVHRYNKHRNRIPDGIDKTSLDSAIKKFTSARSAMTARAVLDTFHNIPAQFVNDFNDDTLQIT
jgi:hypothetical protein